MKNILKNITEKYPDIIGIIITDKEEGDIIEKEGKVELIEESIPVLGTAALTVCKKNLKNKKLEFIIANLKTGEEIVIYEHEEYLIGIFGYNINIQKIREELKEFPERITIEKTEETKKEVEKEKEVVTEVKEKTKIEEKPEEEVVEETPSPEEELTELEKNALNKIKQINELLKEFAPEDFVRWSMVAYAKIKDFSPELAECIERKPDELLLKVPFKKEINEEEANKAFRTTIDIIWKMAVSKFGIKEARNKVKKVAEKLKLLQ